jgi:hypothetical protein
MRNAVAAWALVRGYSEKATGELIDTETVTISSEGGRWKRAERHLAGGLPYGTHGFEAEVEGAICPSTVTGRCYAVGCARIGVFPRRNSRSTWVSSSSCTTSCALSDILDQRAHLNKKVRFRSGSKLFHSINLFFD